MPTPSKAGPSRPKRPSYKPVVYAILDSDDEAETSRSNRASSSLSPPPSSTTKPKGKGKARATTASSSKQPAKGKGTKRKRESDDESWGGPSSEEDDEEDDEDTFDPDGDASEEEDEFGDLRALGEADLEAADQAEESFELEGVGSRKGFDELLKRVPADQVDVPYVEILRSSKETVAKKSVHPFFKGGVPPKPKPKPTTKSFAKASSCKSLKNHETLSGQEIYSLARQAKEKAPKPRKAALVKAKGKTAKPTSKKGGETDEEEGGQDQALEARLEKEEKYGKPLSNIVDIFEDLTMKACGDPEVWDKEKRPKPKGLDLKEVVEKLQGRKLRVATMCSGTEAPLLALELVGDALKKRYGLDLPVEHVFSCEIEPYKQAYIEKNFEPAFLFRDIRELGQDQAHTAYGSLVDVPGMNVDILIAGTSCVDYSHLNNAKKGITDKGESGDTFRGMIEWVRKHLPRIIILENVKTAPYAQMVSYLTAAGYDAGWTDFDTKQHYIPHTRSRGYVVAFRNESRQPMDPDSDDFREVETSGIGKKHLEKWFKICTALKRAPTSTLEAFCLAEDDPRLVQAKTDRAKHDIKTSKKRSTIDWSKSATRHSTARHDEDLGDHRPYTSWREDGSIDYPVGAWVEWAQNQPERVHDLIDISFLRRALLPTEQNPKGKNEDMSYRTIILNVSQNVDRELGAIRVAIVPCLTPSGIFFNTGRGGPLIALEALGFQGLPIDRLILTRETEDELMSLAGNAMTSTVVGTAILAALICSPARLGTPIMDELAMAVDGDSPKVPNTLDASPFNMVGEDKLISRPLDLSSSSSLSLADLCAAATAAARLCDECENSMEIAKDPIVACSACGHTGCVKHVKKPKHEKLRRIDSRRPRSRPVSFEESLKEKLPMRLILGNLTEDKLEHAKSQAESEGNEFDEKSWPLWRDAVLEAFGKEVHFHSIRRGEHWTITYQSPWATLECLIFPSSVEWRLSVKPDPADGQKHLRRLVLEVPVASSIVSVDPLDPLKSDLFSSPWTFALPSTKKFDISIKPSGGPVPSWRSKLGLPGKYATETVFPTLEIEVPEEHRSSLALPIAGLYTWHPDCGTAQSSLHIKKPNEKGDAEVRFFIHQDKIGNSSEDRFVFTGARDSGRLGFEQYRPIVAKLDPSWRQGDDDPSQSVELTIPTSRQSIAGITFSPFGEEDLDASPSPSHHVSTLFQPRSHLEVHVTPDACTESIVFLAFSVQLPHSSDSERAQFEQAFYGGESWTTVDTLRKGRETFDKVAWVTSRIDEAAPAFKALAAWTSVPYEAVVGKAGQDGGTICESCAPTAPDITYIVEGDGKVHPREDPLGAAAYERAIKNRPAEISVQLRKEGNVGHLRIGLNPITMVHRAAKLLPLKDGAEPTTLSYRVTTGHQAVSSRVHLTEPFTFPSNKLDAEFSPSKRLKLKLRPEQRRSVGWALKMERPTDEDVFIEEEISEATLAPMGWRIEGKAERKVKVRGGVLADEVGYGKTAVMLALIDASKDLPSLDTLVEPTTGRINLKATLVVVPSHLVGQWERESKKFLKGVVVLKIDATTMRYTVEDLEEADIVIVSIDVLAKEPYWIQLARFAAGGSLPKLGSSLTRYWKSRVGEVLKSLGPQMDLLDRGDKAAVKEIEENIKASILKENEDLEKAKNDPDRLGMYGKKRMTGSAYARSVTIVESKVAQPAKKKANVEETYKDVWNLKEAKKDSKQAIKIPLHGFRFQRMVIDEYTYASEVQFEALSSLSAITTWILSATPPKESFESIKSIAAFLKVHLGVDDGPRSSGKNIDVTSSEAFHSYKEVHSEEWHRLRDLIAQYFCNMFIRQNIAEIDEIKLEEHIIWIPLPAATRAVYLELKATLQGIEASGKKVFTESKKKPVAAKKNGKADASDRSARIKDAITRSGSMNEALLKNVAYFKQEFDEEEGQELNASTICVRIVESRKEQIKSCMQGIRDIFRVAAHIYPKIKFGPEDKDRNLFLNSFMKSMKTTRTSESKKPSGDAEATYMIRDALKEVGISLKDHDSLKIDQPDIKEKVARERLVKVEIEDYKSAKSTVRDDQIKCLRELTHKLGREVKELSGRVRALRFFETVQIVQGPNGTRDLPPCSKCEKLPLDEKTSLDAPTILMTCGHVGCFGCLAAAHGQCPSGECRLAFSHPQDVIRASELMEDETKSHHQVGRFGSKMTEMVRILKEEVRVKKEGEKEKGDRAIIFVQYEELKKVVEDVLDSENIPYGEMRGSSKKMSETLRKFGDLEEEESPSVLILNLSDASAAGTNLTAANHVIFISPLDAPSQHVYDAANTQAIGRIRRYGQLKKCHVYRLLCPDTIDAEIHALRTGTGGQQEEGEGEDVVVMAAELEEAVGGAGPGDGEGVIAAVVAAAETSEVDSLLQDIDPADLFDDDDDL